MSEPVGETAGEKVVVQIYVVIVALAGVMGFVLGTIRPTDLQPALFGVIALPPTPFGVALYGMVTVGVGLGVFLGLVVYVSRRSDGPAGQ
ncbi:cox cluster protein [Haloarcula sp. S1CR25-12]|uniref:Cox cluster protein n=1 Tax=Haloarcula saliterrae TaxID=2950534 RepID=A0ABU2FBJ5_9EURY|nr:cox cluster protein [Haloarcula sp. S1CR25-12]MDS0259210.1 cox cluster protein [Haloarcula sp. S1CR25-12]